jgi:glyoxylase-like metal-dependent hydrolase (beta-lactamase superfamily II)
MVKTADEQDRVQVTGVAQRAAWLARTSVPVEQVRPGLWSVPVPIPQSPLRYTLSYLFASDAGIVVVDPGWDTDTAWAALTNGLAAAGATVSDVTGVVVTHVHPDHHGLSTRIRNASGAWVAMHPADRDTLTARTWNAAAGPAADRAWFRSCGVPDDDAAALALTGDSVAPFLEMAEPDVLLEDGDQVPVPGGAQIRAVWTPGHTPGHLCLYDEAAGVLLTGDHLLPRITPNVGLQAHGETASLSQYLTSLRRLEAYDTAEALPGHEYRFRGITARVRALLRHHEERCQEILAVLRQHDGRTVWQVTQRLSWSRGWDAVHGFMRRAALGETAAHLEHLCARGDVSRAPGEPALWRLDNAGSEPAA